MVVIRSATAADAAVIASIQNELLATTTIEWADAQHTAAGIVEWLDAHDVVLVAEDNGEVVGHVQLVTTADASTLELKSMAVADGRRGTGIGRALVESAIEAGQARGATRLVVATATADIDNLRFYQRRGFRMLSIERDAFDAASGYPETIHIDGIPLRDRIWLDQELPQSARP
jgi:predicted N-acetyltransferase YhbS